MVATLFAFLLNNYLNYLARLAERDVPCFAGCRQLRCGSSRSRSTCSRSLSRSATCCDSRDAACCARTAKTIYAITAYIVRAAFWAVLLVGLADAVVSFLRVEGFLPALVGNKLTIDLGRSSFRGTGCTFPLIVLGIVIAIFHRGLGFPWLALLVVAAELLIVISRFIFSYEQAFMGDLVRFWYGALFLFASAYTLLEEGHVRVDVLYAGFNDRTKGIVNAIGCILLGMSLCWVIIIYGMGSQSAVINSPLLSFEVTQTGFGMYVKYWMAGFLAIFAITMLLQFSGYFLEGDRRLSSASRASGSSTRDVAHEHYET